MDLPNNSSVASKLAAELQQSGAVGAPPGNEPSNISLAPIGYTIEKKPLGVKFQELFLASNTKTIKQHIFGKVIIPNILKFVTDSAHGVIDSLFNKAIYNGQNPTMWNGGWNVPYYNYNYVNYSGYSQPVMNSLNNISGMNNPAMATQSLLYNYKYLPWGSEDEAKLALAKLRDQIAQYGRVSINTYLSLMGRTGELTGWNYGWRDLSQSTVFNNSGFWYITFPEPIVIK